MASGTLAPAFWFTAIDDDGLLLPGALLSFFLSGTTTPAVVYHDSDLLVPWTQPAICDAAGRIVVYMDPAVGDLKMTMTDALGVPVGPTVDPVSSTAAGAGPGGVGAEIYSFGSNSSVVITDTTYPSGATFDKLQPGTGVWLVDPATLTGTYVLEVTGVMTLAGTLTVALMNLDGGAPDTPIAAATVTSLTGEVAQSAAIVFPAGGTTVHFGIKTIVSANDGFLRSARIVRTA
jgi:hypothetical protein